MVSRLFGPQVVRDAVQNLLEFSLVFLNWPACNQIEEVESNMFVVHSTWPSVPGDGKMFAHESLS